MPQPHERQDMQMLARLGHDPVVGRHHEDDHVHAMRAGYHVADEVHVARHIHDAHDPVVGQAAGSEAQVDGQAALLLLRERVGFAAGEQLDERAFAVIDVPGGAEHDVLAGGAHAVRVTARELQYIGSRVRSGVAFPLTPALSLGERGDGRRRIREAGTPGILDRRASVPPLPWG